MSTDSGVEPTCETITLRELLKLVDSKKISIEAANEFFVKHLFGVTVVLREVRPHRSRTVREDEEDCGEFFEVKKRRVIVIFDMGTCSTFLRHFGRSVTKMCIEYSMDRSNVKHSAQLDHILNDYCTDYLTEIELKFAPSEAMKYLKKPFQAAEHVRFVKCDLTGKLRNLNDFFPNMRSLQFEDDKKQINSKIFQTRYPHLENLNFYYAGSRKDEHVGDLFHMNSKLKSLSIGGCSAKLLQRVSKHLQSVETLIIPQLTRCSELDGELIHFKSVKKIDFTMCGFDFTSNPPFKRIEDEIIPLSFDQLEELNINRLSSFADINFIVKHPTITKLKIEIMPIPKSSLSAETLSKIANGLPLLTEVDFGNCSFSPEEATHFMDKCKSLKEFRFQLDDRGKFDALLERLGSEWEGHIEGSYFPCIFLKKK